MGSYINPPDQTKEEWLEEHGTPVTAPEWAGRPEGTIPVVLVVNSWGTAAAVAYCEGEFDFFVASESTDNRHRSWFYAPKDALYGVSDLKVYEAKLST
jgi:hypothetical protein